MFKIYIFKLLNLNTSHVNVNQEKTIGLIIIANDLNTSHVNVNLYIVYFTNKYFLI